MNIIGINETHTKGANEVAFDLSPCPEVEVISRIKPIDGITIRVLDGAVVLKTEYEPLALESSHVDAFVDAYHAAQSSLKQAERSAERARRHMLERISSTLSLPLTSQVESDD